MNQSSFEKKAPRFYINRDIRLPTVICIAPDGEFLGEMETRFAIQKAKDLGLDLVQIVPPKNGKTATCKIMDAGKYKFDLSKKERDQNRKQREAAVELKEIKLRANTDTHDLLLKATQSEKFLREGNKVKVKLQLRGRENNNVKFTLDTKVQEFLSLAEIVPDGNINYAEKTITFFLKLK